MARRVLAAWPSNRVGRRRRDQAPLFVASDGGPAGHGRGAEVDQVADLDLVGDGPGADVAGHRANDGVLHGPGNNAGMSPVYDSLGSVTEKLFDVVLNLNLKGPFRLSALVGERMVAAGRGSIINVSSTGSIRPVPSIVPYAAAKAGLNAMTEGLAAAFGPAVRVNTLMSGPFRTDASKHWDMPVVEEAARAHALARIADPREIVGAALYLACDASSYTTCATLRVDGGIP